MNKEFLTIQEKETAIKIRNTKVEAVRIKDILKKGVRVYDGGKIGISGAIGEVSDEVLVENAVQNLNTDIDYPYALSGNTKDHRSYNDNPITAEELLSHSESILETLRKDYSDFDFSEGILVKETVQKMHNTQGLDLEYKDAYLDLGLVLKDKKSANLFDGFLMYSGRRFDIQKFWGFNRSFLEAYRNNVELPEGDVLPVFTLETTSLFGFMMKSLNGERYATGSSLFSGKIGEQLFSDKVTLEQNRDPQYAPLAFFDKEGVILPDDRHVLIDSGKLTSVFTDKKNAAQYNLPHTGSASGGYDDMPTLSGAPLRFRTDSDNLKGALKGQPAILSVVSSGGDFTPDGSYAAPVQVSFLFDGERIIGKLPEFTMRSHLNKMLGEDYIGTFDNSQFYISDLPTQLQGYYMTIVR